ncbi:MAG: BlaI/MecI/CopY family transcriptional regulator [Pirellulaceae bacterium]
MGKKKQKKPSAGEMELLGLLWEHGPMSLAEAHHTIQREIGYTTIQTRLNRLVDNGFATREKQGRQPTRYRAAVDSDQIGAGVLDQIVSQVTRGKVVPLVAHLVQNSDLSPDELAELKQLVREAEQRQKLGQEKST